MQCPVPRWVVSHKWDRNLSISQGGAHERTCRIIIRTYNRIIKSGYRSGSSGRIKNLSPYCNAQYQDGLFPAKRIKICPSLWEEFAMKEPAESYRNI